MRHLRRLAAVVAALVMPCPGWAAQPYPDKPIRLVVPYAPGGGTDSSARVIAKHLGDALGQPVIVDNRPGAGTLIGSALVAKAAPDGYTLLYGSVTHTIAPALYKDRMPFDAIKDFTPITQIATFPFVILTRPKTGIHSVAELIAQAKAHPGHLNYASVGNGTGTNLSGEMLKLMTGTDIVHVPYNGSAPAMTGLLGDQVQIAISDPPPAIAHIKSGAVIALAVTTPRRSASLPNVPTLAEAGVKGFDFTSWWGVFAPAGLPQSIVDRLNTELRKTLELPDVKATLAAFAAEPAGDSAQDFAQLVRQEVAKYDKLVADAHISIE